MQYVYWAICIVLLAVVFVVVIYRALGFLFIEILRELGCEEPEQKTAPEMDPQTMADLQSLTEAVHGGIFGIGPI